MKPQSTNPDLPQLTTFQFAVLDILGMWNAPFSGKNLRACLKVAGINKSGPAFYLLMREMETAELVRKCDGTKTITGIPIRVRAYERTELGARALREALNFK